MELTQIQVTKKTRKELQKLKRTKLETYEEIIQGLLQIRKSLKVEE